MVITIYGNSVKSHDHMNDISELGSKNQSEWYKVDDTHNPPTSRAVTFL